MTTERFEHFFNRRDAVAGVFESIDLLQEVGLDAHHAWVLCGIARHLTYKSMASVGIAQLAKETLLSESCVIAKVADLIRAGFLTLERLPAAVNSYRLRLPAQEVQEVVQ